MSFSLCFSSVEKEGRRELVQFVQMTFIGMFEGKLEECFQNDTPRLPREKVCFTNFRYN